jgi:threonine aldolase
VLAAAGILALEQMVPRLPEDHANAALLAQGVRDAGLEVTHPVRTNIVNFRAPDPHALAARLRQEGVLVNVWHDGLLRAITHHDAPRPAVERACAALRKAAR